MESLDSFRKRCDSIIDKAYQGGVTLLNFLDEAEVGVLESMMKHHQSLNLFSDGKIINSDRKRYIITPYDNNIDFKINIFKIKYNNKYYDINHRNVLGSLMSLGIKRECIGDIIIDSNNVYFACTYEITPFLLEEFKFVGKAPIELELINYDVTNVIKYDYKTYFVASIRFDSIIAEGFNISRNEAQDMIINGLAYINHLLCQNVSNTVKLNDIISVRHKGKIILAEIGGKSKSGRIAVTIGKRM